MKFSIKTEGISNLVATSIPKGDMSQIIKSNFFSLDSSKALLKLEFLNERNSWSSRNVWSRSCSNGVFCTRPTSVLRLTNSTFLKFKFCEKNHCGSVEKITKSNDCTLEISLSTAHVRVACPNP